LDDEMEGGEVEVEGVGDAGYVGCHVGFLEEEEGVGAGDFEA
jgi:hypothetical protein